MSSRKKSTSSTESSSGTTSDSSSSSGSSSGSDSNSSSSDSESSSSPESTRRNSSASTTTNANTNNVPSNDIKSAGATSNPNSANSITASAASTTTTATTTTKKAPPRRVSVTKAQTKISDNNIDKIPTATANKNKAIAAVTKSQQQRPPPRPQIYSSDEDIVPTTTTKVPSTNQQTNKKALNDIKKKTAPIQQQQTKSKSTAPASTGGKAPPSVVKQQQQQQQQQQLSSLTKTVTNNKPQTATAKNPVKPAPSGNATIIPKATVIDSKKKSIFSPVNSSESDDEEVTKKIPKSNVIKAKPPQPSAAAASAAAASATTVSTTAPLQPSTLVKAKGRTINRSKLSDKSTSKSSSDSSGSSSQSGSTTSSDSESDSSADSSPATIKKSSNKKAPVKTPPSTSKSESKDNGNSDSDLENNKPKQNVVRKLTRSSSTRKSKHLTAIFNPGKTSETESESESKRSLSKSPVKRAPGITKGKSKNSKTNAKQHNSSPVKRVNTVPEERRCPIDACDSNGHLGGHLDKHFTQEACPLYHNMTLADTKAWALERVQRDDERKKALILYEPGKKQVTVEQKAYQLKVRDIRSKFKPNPPSPSRAAAAAHAAANMNREREPNLMGMVSDYDLQLFREAQALASEKIENEVKDTPVGKGTKYIIMGRHTMEVWYQSPYPDDAARLPKLYLCEFCLRYQKSEVGMKRHAAKCVWRHPPGDEIYRKGKLGVWQVDGKRHKQYCQHLCLLAKFFLDHKTLYYDVEPFLFYVMTLTDNEGCHTVGYFSKEKNSFLNYNVSCILTLPPYQRKGYGRLLIDFSYLLTRVEGKIGSPEKPLSDLGLISYRSYWKDVLLDYLCSRSGITLSIKDVSQEMAINSYDIVSTLQALGMMKYWKGKHIILKKQDVLEEYAERVKSRGTVLKIDPSCLRWTPFVPPAPPGPS